MKVRFLFMVLMIILGRSATQAQIKLITFQENEKWGFKDEKGTVMIKTQFIIAHNFLSTGIVAVVDSIGWAYINTEGNVVIRPFIYDNGPDYFSEGFARFTSDDKFGFFDETGQIIIEPQFDFVFPFSEGLSAICMGCKKRKEDEHRVVEGGKWGYIDTQGEVIIDVKFEHAKSFERGRARVMMNGQWMTIDKKGNTVR